MDVGNILSCCEEGKTRPAANLDFVFEKEVGKIWDTYDTNGDGVLDREECFIFIRDLMSQSFDEDLPTNMQLSDMFLSLDLDGDGKIDKNEMTQFLKSITGL